MIRYGFLLLFLVGCGGGSPGRFYLESVDMPALESSKIQESVDLLNANQESVYKTGSRPIKVKSASLDGLNVARSTPRSYGCVIEIDSTNSLISSDPDIIKLIFAQQLGHCLGIPYSRDPSSVMYYSLVSSWSVFWEEKIKEFGQEIKNNINN